MDSPSHQCAKKMFTTSVSDPTGVTMLDGAMPYDVRSRSDPRNTSRKPAHHLHIQTQCTRSLAFWGEIF